ncbi:MAG: hypothetical protein ACTTKO_08420 [Candidatus Limimorpha sp.]
MFEKKYKPRPFAVTGFSERSKRKSKSYLYMIDMGGNPYFLCNAEFVVVKTIPKCLSVLWGQIAKHSGGSKRDWVWQPSM